MYKRQEYEEKEKKVVVYINQETKVIIPSRLYPLEKENYRIVTPDNTEPITDPKVIEIFDTLEVRLGECFSNAEKLTRALRDAGYPAEQYVGWIFAGEGTYPVHHSFVMLENHILDNSVEFLKKDMADFYYMQLKYRMSQDELRMYMIEQHQAKKDIKNHKKCNVGKCDSYYIYVGTEGSAEQGRSRNIALRQEYPQHPSFQDVHNGMTRIQSMMRQHG